MKSVFLIFLLLIFFYLDTDNKDLPTFIEKPPTADLELDIHSSMSQHQVPSFLCPDCHYTGKDRQYVLRHYTGAPPGPVAVGYGGGQTSHQSVSRPYGEHRSIVQFKAFGAAHASVSQVDNSKGLAEIQPALGANKPLPVGHGAVATLATHVVHGPLIHATPRLLLQKLLMEPGLSLDLTLSLCLM